MSRDYVRLIKASELAADSLRVVEIGSERICLANVGGKMYAIGDTCTHEECSLSEGLLEGKIVECLCHGSQFDVTTGNVVRGPATEEEPAYDVKVQNDEVYIKPSR
jgi:3-phenylpropionate/trans-cinnamate dioxygenase ferredoxin subunit